MSDSFTPLLARATPRPDGATSFPIQVLSEKEVGTVFQALATRAQSPFPAPAESAAPAPAATPSPCEARPKVAVHRDGDRVTCIQIRCGCGQLLELDCVY